MNFMTRTDKVILTTATLIVAIFSYFLYDDSLLFKEVAETQEKSIGNISFLKNDVRLKSTTAFAWRTAGRQLEVHQKDSVFTGDGSEVSIQLNDGSILNLKENSLITLIVRDGETSLDLKYGDFVGQLTQDSKLKVTAGKETYDLKGEKSANNEKTILQLNKSRSGQLEVKLQQGAANVKTKKQTRVLEKDRSVSLTTKLAEKPLPEISLLVPNRTVMKQFRDGDVLPLSWSATEKISQFQVEVARDSLFKDLAWVGKSKDSSLNAPVRAGEGEFYWRVKALTNSGQEITSSPVHTFKIVRLEAPTLLSPEKDQVINLESRPGSTQETLKSTFKIIWTAPKDVKNFHYQIANDSEFKNIIKDQVVTGLESLSPAVASGEYFVKVRAEKDADRFSRWSEVGSVKLTVKTEQRPPAPRLVKNNVEFNPATAEKRTPSSEPVAILSWVKPIGITQFKIQISKTKNFTEPKTFSVNGDNFDFKDSSPGVTYFRVYSINNRGLASIPSEVGQILVTIIDPKLSPMNNILVNGKDKDARPPSKEMSMTWSPVPGADKYLLEVSMDANFKDAKKFEVKTASMPVLLDKPGTYHARVVAMNEQGKTISSFSKIEKFDYTYRIPLDMPSPLEPFDKTTVFMQQEQAAFLWLEWKSVKGTKQYKLEVSTSPTFDTIALKADTKEPRFLVKEKLPAGKLFWRVKAISESADMSSEWTNANEFSLISNKNETYR